MLHQLDIKAKSNLAQGHETPNPTVPTIATNQKKKKLAPKPPNRNHNLPKPSFTKSPTTKTQATMSLPSYPITFWIASKLYYWNPTTEGLQPYLLPSQVDPNKSNKTEKPWKLRSIAINCLPQACHQHSIDLHCLVFDKNPSHIKISLPISPHLQICGHILPQQYHLLLGMGFGRHG